MLPVWLVEISPAQSHLLPISPLRSPSPLHLSRTMHYSRRKAPSIMERAGSNPASNSATVDKFLSFSEPWIPPWSFRKNVRLKCLHRVLF